MTRTIYPLGLATDDHPKTTKSDANACLAGLKMPLDIESEKKRLPDVSDGFFWSCIERCYSSTLLSSEKLFNLFQATEYIVHRKIAGDMVECGVFLGGAAMLMACKLKQLGDMTRTIWLYDTFAGFTGQVTGDDFNLHGKKIGSSIFNNFLQQTKDNIAGADYPMENFVFVEGDVCDTVPVNPSAEIGLLRLDTDTYTSTICELEHLYPKLATGGVLIIDDYGYSLGVRKAVDEYFTGNRPALFFQRPDYSSRTAVKL